MNRKKSCLRARLYSFHEHIKYIERFAFAFLTIWSWYLSNSKTHKIVQYQSPSMCVEHQISRSRLLYRWISVKKPQRWSNGILGPICYSGSIWPVLTIIYEKSCVQTDLEHSDSRSGQKSQKFVVCFCWYYFEKPMYAFMPI